MSRESTAQRTDLSRRQSGALLLCAVVLVAANLRMSLMAVGPLLEDIAADRGVAVSSLGLLASIPLVVWGIVSPLSHSLGMKIGMSRAISLSLIALTVGTILRSMPGLSMNLWLGTVLIGGAIAVGNVLMPAVLKKEFPEHVALLMGVYTALLGGIGSIGAGMVVPIAHSEVGGAQLGWGVALACTGALAIPALIVWVISTKNRPGLHPSPVRAKPQSTGSVGKRVWRDRLAWLVAIYMGSQSLSSYTYFAWLSPILISRGVDPVPAGLYSMVFQAMGVIGSLLVPVLFRWKSGRWIPALVPIGTVVATCFIVLLPEPSLFWIVIGGIVTGTSFATAMTVIAFRASSHTVASALSGMAQSVGYLVAALGPALFGLLHGLSGGWGVPLILLIASLSVQIVVGLIVGAPKYVLPEELEDAGTTLRVEASGAASHRETGHPNNPTDTSS